MAIRIAYESPAALAAYGQVSTAFTAATMFRVETEQRGLGGIRLREVPVAHPYVVDYDMQKGQGPERWLDRWDLHQWGVIAAYDEEERVGGAVLAYDTPGVNMLDGRTDLAVMWDLRVKQSHRRSGVGAALLTEAVQWARKRHCKQLKIETQSDNVAACKFYASQGAVLGAINRYAYPEEPQLSSLIWYIDVQPPW